MKQLVTVLCMAFAATAFASAGDAHAFDWMAFGRWTVLVICGMALAAPLVTGLRRLARLAVPALFAFLLLGLGIFATTPNGGVPTREEKERLRAELVAAIHGEPIGHCGILDFDGIGISAQGDCVTRKSYKILTNGHYRKYNERED